MRTKRPLREPVREAPGPKLKNYITPAGLQRLKDEHRFLLSRERPAVTQVVAWAAGNGDRSENADYQYGKRRLREIDRRGHGARREHRRPGRNRSRSQLHQLGVATGARVDEVANGRPRGSARAG